MKHVVQFFETNLYLLLLVTDIVVWCVLFLVIPMCTGAMSSPVPVLLWGPPTPGACDVLRVLSPARQLLSAVYNKLANVGPTHPHSLLDEMHDILYNSNV